MDSATVVCIWKWQNNIIILENYDCSSLKSVPCLTCLSLSLAQASESFILVGLIGHGNILGVSCHTISSVRKIFATVCGLMRMVNSSHTSLRMTLN